ncbi:MAG: hypothetical protein KBI47_18055 [Armatimonadetes bacterium]|jgi:hypothetical protein|nr:hypothetical protein [Armatimonadota bacterium]MDI9585366.1 hypothetical protein [Acidobacteriota bacterium]
MAPGTFTLTVLNIPDIDRGVGLAIILQTSGGSTVLYDTGTGYPEGDGWQGGWNRGPCEAHCPEHYITQRAPNRRNIACVWRRSS